MKKYTKNNIKNIYIKKKKYIRKKKNGKKDNAAYVIIMITL